MCGAGRADQSVMRVENSSGFVMLEWVALLVVITLLAVLTGTSVSRAATSEAIARNRAVAVQLADNAARLRGAWLLEGGRGPIEDFAGLGDGTVDLNAAGWVVGRSAGPRPEAASTVQCTEILGVLAPRVRATASTAATGADYRVEADGVGGCRFVRLARGGGPVVTASGCPLQIRYTPVPGEGSVSTACEDVAGPFVLLRESDAGDRR